MVYASKEQYLSEHNLIPDEQIERRLKQASRHIDSLTFNRITSRSFDNLTEFQQAIIIDVCCDMADFEYENEDMINCVLQNYAVNGVSMQFGSSWNVLVQNGIAVKRDTYRVLCQTGLCCLSLGGVSMRYPCLILKSMCKTEIHVEIEQEGRNVYGEPLEPVIWDGLCNYQDSGKTELTAEKVLIQLEGCALIPGDIAPDLPVITKGDIKVFGVTRHIYKGTKCRNPDGTVNYVRLDVM